MTRVKVFIVIYHRTVQHILNYHKYSKKLTTCTYVVAAAFTLYALTKQNKVKFQTIYVSTNTITYSKPIYEQDDRTSALKGFEVQNFR